MLQVLADFPSPTSISKVVIATPRLYLVNREQHIQVLEDFPDTSDLKSAIISSNINSALPQAFAVSIGHAIGSWIWGFHDWASAPAQTELRAKIAKNESMRKLKQRVTYDSFVDVVQRFPDIFENSKDHLLDVKGMMAEESIRAVGPEELVERVIIHGDFWTGKLVEPLSLDEIITSNVHVN